METYDTYCLLPEGGLSADPLDRLFEFTSAVYHHPKQDIALESGDSAVRIFETEMDGPAHIRFDSASVPNTEGGWLYKLEDGSAVIGLSGDASVSRHYFEKALLAVIPGGVCCTPGDQPPPASRDEFIEMARAQA